MLSYTTYAMVHTTFERLSNQYRYECDRLADIRKEAATHWWYIYAFSPSGRRWNRADQQQEVVLDMWGRHLEDWKMATFEMLSIGVEGING